MQEQESNQSHYKLEPLRVKNNGPQKYLKIAVCTWNLVCSLPPTNSTKIMMDYLVDDLLSYVYGSSNNNDSNKKSNKTNNHGQTPDIILIATQQCERSYCSTFCCESKDQWQNALRQISLNYELVDTHTLMGLHSAVLIRRNMANKYRLLKKSVYKAGACNLLGNKGAVSLCFSLCGQQIQFINCHLAAQQSQSAHRNQVLMGIINNFVDPDYRKQVILCGDLNYRIELKKQEYLQKVQSKYNSQQQMKYMSMLSLDQLSNQQILCDQFLPLYKQEQIRFPPTYKLSVNSPEYNKSRIPGWTDRIFMRKGRLRQINYLCLYELYGSDHRPVIAGYQLKIETGLAVKVSEIEQKDGACQLI